MAPKATGRRRRRGRILACAVIITLPGGCAQQEDERAVAEPAVDSISNLQNTTNLLLPLDTYMYSLEEYRLLSKAHLLLLGQCMQRFGISYPTSEPTARGGLRTRNQHRYGVTDPAEAKRFGYRVPGMQEPEPPPEDKDPRVIAYLTGEGLPAARNAVPVPPGGCVADSQRILRGGATELEDIAEPMAMKSWKQSEADPRVQRVFAQWSTCMGRAGFSYLTPLDPFRDRALMSNLSSTQVATAVADTNCKRTFNVVGVWAAVEAAYQRALIVASRPALEALRVANAARLKVASAVVEGRYG